MVIKKEKKRKKKKRKSKSNGGCIQLNLYACKNWIFFILFFPPVKQMVFDRFLTFAPIIFLSNIVMHLFMFQN